jgi:hypothetical protein
VLSRRQAGLRSGRGSRFWQGPAEKRLRAWRYAANTKRSGHFQQGGFPIVALTMRVRRIKEEVEREFPIGPLRHFDCDIIEGRDRRGALVESRSIGAPLAEVERRVRSASQDGQDGQSGYSREGGSGHVRRKEIGAGKEVLQGRQPRRWAWG